MACPQKWEEGGLIIAMVAQLDIDPTPIKLIILFISLVFIIPITKMMFRMLRVQVELFLKAQREQDGEMNDVEP